MRGIRSPATTMTSKAGRSAGEGRSQPRVNSRWISERIQRRTSVLVRFKVVERLCRSQSLEEFIRQLVSRDGEHHVGRAAARALMALRVVDELALMAAGVAAKTGHHRPSVSGRAGGEISVSVSVSRS